MSLKRYTGFTLAELLIALAILGVIATFTIPKVLQSQQDSKYNAIWKEDAAAMAVAFQIYQQSNTVDASTRTPSLTPYLNFVRYDTSSTIDDTYGSTTLSCTSTVPCLHMHNGSIIYFANYTAGGTATTNAIQFVVDPNENILAGSTTNSTEKGVWGFIYLNGRVTTIGGLSPGTMSGGSTQTRDPNQDPPWLKW